ncbi:anhydro-N-acetylmuramic acid kinase [Mucilaginibacter myungsuensis]|uniref:Anhydro-N-acetylmuramic acid kinase n=1 Tax=Mucilaginibacter myungsuensis TaxID=649104 RepID=A0A929PX62_9SPHI|nr:anhydro-N-acetylmuramic acid kinase [Mucilaginibacter myungsuensis]MBE9663528.1 anhydro-N-acetylmuramic acid kinase [Mucilaginibacter myungsuensis]MDN3600266.1 anhydro-N-acetylmuramic acid kinase [Mucilaginibacter myungsuensis]
MNKNLQQLFTIAQKEERLAIGLMSGTSLDGLDIALCRFSRHGLGTKFDLLHFITIAYDDTFKGEVIQLFAKKQVDLEKLCMINAYIGIYHAQLILDALQQWNVAPADVDFIASHGQTIYHAPQRLHGQANYPNATLQIGDGDHIAVKTGIITISDFRQKHIAAGGEGAPLALYGDVIFGSHPTENRILLNIGGIANLTYLPANGAEIICCDTGPGNTMIDAACRQYFNRPYDEDAKIALSGQVNESLLNALLKESFFAQPAPKTTGPELFSLAYLEKARQASNTTDLTAEDIVATLSQFTVQSIVDFINTYCQPETLTRILISGGGAKNKFVVDGLTKLLPQATISDSNYLGVDPDAKEAILFALLGNEALVGEPMTIGGNPAVLMGKFSFPG